MKIVIKKSSIISFANRLCCVCSLLLACSLSQSCTENDGDWESMKWESEINISGKNEISVPAEGGQIILKCTNYESPWLCDASETIENSTNHFQIDGLGTDSPDYRSIHTNFATIKCVNNEVVVNVQPNDSEERILKFNVTAGNVFDCFTFIQKPKNYALNNKSYYSISSEGGNKTIQFDFSNNSDCNCMMMYDGDMFCSINDIKRDGCHISINLNISPNSGMGRACGLHIMPKDGDDFIIGLWQQPRAFLEKESFEVQKAGQLGVMLGDDVQNYAKLRNVSISGSLNANDMSVIKRLFNKSTYNVAVRPDIKLDLSGVNISDTNKNSYYKHFGNIGFIDEIIAISYNTLSSDVFSMSDNLIAIKLPSSVTDIDKYAFQYCTKLEKVILPLDCKRIGSYAFYNCSNLISIESYDKTANDYCRITSIGDYAFSGIGELEYLILSEELIDVTSRSLLGFNVRKLYVIKQMPPDIKIYGLYNKCNLYVPKGALESYRSSIEWGKFQTITEVSFDGDYRFQ